MAADKVTKTLPVSFSDVQVAMGRIRQHVHYTPMMQCSHLDSVSGYQLHFKCEMFQKTGAFKVWNCTGWTGGPAMCTHIAFVHTLATLSITICHSWENIHNRQCTRLAFTVILRTLTIVNSNSEKKKGEDWEQG